MFNFSDFSDIRNVSDNYTENVIDKQNKEFLKKQHKILHEGFQPNHPNQTKGTSSFRDPSVLMNNFEYTEPSEQTVRNTINKSNKQTQGTIGLVNQASYVNDPSVAEISKQFTNQYTDYSQVNDTILKNAKEYIDKGESIDTNVFVNSLSNDNTTQFINLYNDDPNNTNPDVLKYDNMYIDSCRDLARIKGYNNFSVGYTDQFNQSQCKIAKDISNLTTSGIYIPNCKVGTDGKTYGGGWGNAIYENDGNISKYIGCYKDAQDRAMISAGTEEHNNPVYAIGNYGCAPWGTSNGDFPSSEAQWIWYTDNAGAGAPVNTGNPVTLRGTIDVTSNNIIYCEVFCIGDDICNIIVNGNNKNEPLFKDSNTDARNLICDPEEMIVRYPSNSKTGYIVAFYPGKNIVDLQVVNTGGPAGVILCFIQENNTSVENNSIKISSASTGTNVFMYTGGSFMSNWSYITNNNNAVTPFSQSFSVETCGKYAYDNGYQYFAVQNMLNNDPNSAQCFISNDLNASTKYGKWDGSTTYEGNTLGLGPVSAVYSFNSPGNYDNLGKIGYMNENSQLLEYPSSMVQQGTSTTYNTLLNVDSPGNDIANFTLNKQDCEQKCNENTDCYGYVYVSDSNQCWIKNKNMFSYMNKDGPLTPYNGLELNFKDVQVLNNNSCPKKIKNINSLEWDNFNKSQEVMNMDTTCRLEKINNQLITERDEKETGLNWVMSQLSKGLSSFMTTNKTMTHQMGVEHNVMKENTSLYNVLYDKYKEITGIDNSNINNILANSQIIINQSRYFYILWVVLAIAIIIALIMLIRRITNS